MQDSSSKSSAGLSSPQPHGPRPAASHSPPSATPPTRHPSSTGRSSIHIQMQCSANTRIVGTLAVVPSSNNFSSGGPSSAGPQALSAPPLSPQSLFVNLWRADVARKRSAEAQACVRKREDVGEGDSDFSASVFTRQQCSLRVSFTSDKVTQAVLHQKFEQVNTAPARLNGTAEQYIP